MNHNGHNVNGFSAHFSKTWESQIITICLDSKIKNIKLLLKTLCEKYLKKISKTNSIVHANSFEPIKRRKVLESIKSLSTTKKKFLQYSLPLTIYLIKAYEELVFHGLRNCQKYLVDLVSSEKLLSAEDNELLHDEELKTILNLLEINIGKYFEKYESLNYFFKQLETLVNHCESEVVYCHPKFECLRKIIIKCFESFPGVRAVIICQSSFYMLEVCNFLLRLQPLVKPMIYIGREEKIGSVTEGFSQEAKNIVRKLFQSKQFNVLVRSCHDVEFLNIEEVQLLIHLDLEQHVLKENLWSLFNYNLDFCEIQVYFDKKIQTFLKSLDIFLKSPNKIPKYHVEKKRKFNELNKSLTERSFIEQSLIQFGKKLKHSILEMQESAFHSFELDDKFLSKLDVQISEYENIQEKSPKRNNIANEKSVECQPGAFVSCLSPILKPLLETSKTGFISSSTPINKSLVANGSNGQLERHDNFSEDKKNVDFKNYNFIDLDLFEDWNSSVLFNKKNEDSNSLITITQAVEMVERTEKQFQTGFLKKNNYLSNSMDLISDNQKTTDCLFNDSFDLATLELLEKEHYLKLDSENITFKNSEKNDSTKTQSVGLNFQNELEKCQEKENNLNSEIRKPRAAHKLNFEDLKSNSCSQDIPLHVKNVNSKRIEFTNDYSFDAFLQSSFLAKLKNDDIKGSLSSSKTEENIIKSENVEKSLEQSNFDNSTESTEESLDLFTKRGKLFKIEESDIESSDEYKTTLASSKKNLSKRNSLNKLRLKMDLLDQEAEVSKDCDVSSDEDLSNEDEYEESFVDDESHFSQNDTSKITAKYLESVKMTNNRPGTYKIPELKPYLVEDIFSQTFPDSNSDYEINSFCVDNIEYEAQEPTNLEVAEQILEMRKKKKKIKNRK